MDERENLLLPIANVGRIMKKILPPNAKLSKEAKERMQECASEFISFVTGEASHKCHNENRKTLNGDDICCALATLGFEDYSEAMTRYLNRFREFEMCKCKHRTQKCRKGFHSEEKDEESCSYRSIEQETTTSAPRSFDFGIVEKKTL